MGGSPVGASLATPAGASRAHLQFGTHGINTPYGVDYKRRIFPLVVTPVRAVAHQNGALQFLLFPIDYHMHHAVLSKQL